MNGVEYVLTMNSDQAHTALKAIDLLMRLKINQPEEIAMAVMSDDYFYEKTGKVNKERFNEHIHRRDAANGYVKMAFRQIFPTWEDVRKNEEWYRLYNLYQAIRYQIHLAENPGGKGVDSRPPMQLTDEPMPDCRFRKEVNKSNADI